MFWDGDRWLPDEPVKPTPRRRSWFAGSIGALALAAVLAVTLLPLGGGEASAMSSGTLLRRWESVGDVSAIQESSSRITYKGKWQTAKHANYLNGKVRASDAKGARATLRFNGSAIAWVGPVGPTRGKAAIYLDGELVKTVSSYARTYRASQVLFQHAWPSKSSHTISIVVKGTKGHPTVALDAFIVQGPTAAPTQAPTAAPTATPAPTVTTDSSVRVTSVTALLSALADNAVAEVVVANGTYRVSPASAAKSDSLWIGARFAGRTNPVTVRAETVGGVTFDGAGSTAFGGLTFVEGAHHQTWEGFNFANGSPVQTGVIVFGGYAGRTAPHNITLRSIKLLPSITGSTNGDHGIYFSYAVGGPHDILIEDFTVDGGPGLSDALHFYHSDAANLNVWNLTVRRLTVNRTEQPIRMWDSSLRNILIDGATIRDATLYGIRVESPGQGITFRNVTTINSAQRGFYSSAGNPPPGVTFINNTFN